MSINLGSVAAKLFEKEAIQEFQDKGTSLRNAVRVRNARGASQVQFQVIGKATANERTSIQTPIPVSDVSHTPATATVKNYVVSEMTDIFKNEQVGFDERQELVESFSGSLNRRLDQVIIDALDVATISKTVADTISGGADNLTSEAFVESARLLGSDVPDTDRHFLCHDDGFYHFIQEPDVKDIDTNFRKPLADGMLPNWMGFNIHKLGDRDEGGLEVPTASHRTNYAWQKSALGLAVNLEPKITIDWEPSFGAWRVSGYLSAGAVVIQPAGVVQITNDES